MTLLLVQLALSFQCVAGGIVFLTSKFYQGGELQNADQLCQDEADLAQLNHTIVTLQWKALLASPTGNQPNFYTMPAQRADLTTPAYFNDPSKPFRPATADACGKTFMQFPNKTKIEYVGYTWSGNTQNCSGWTTSDNNFFAGVGVIRVGSTTGTNCFGNMWTDTNKGGDINSIEKCGSHYPFWCAEMPKPPTQSPTRAPSKSPTSPSSAPTTKSPTTSPSSTPTTKSPTTAPSKAPTTASLQKALGDVNTFCSGGQLNYVKDGKEYSCKKEIEKVVVKEQQTSVNVFILVVAVVLGLDVIIVLLSKCLLRDPDPDYSTMVMCSLSLLDFTSDFLTILSIRNIAKFSSLFVAGCLSLGITSVVNVFAAAYLLKREQQRSPQFNKWWGNSSAGKPVFVFLFFLSVCKANFTFLLATGLFAKKTDLFKVPMSAQLKMEFRVIAVVQILLEDIPQMVILFSLEQQPLQDWTILNKLSFSVAAVAMGVSFLFNNVKLVNKHFGCCCLKNKFADKDRNIGVEMQERSHVGAHNIVDI